MIFHGKNTVPPKLRKDMWLPFYSVHFSDAKQGLRAYHLLREFSVQRQLAPPRDMITITPELLDRKRPQDPLKAEAFNEQYVPRIGKLMPPEWRRKAVMDQKATSVADIAAVIAIQEEEIANGFGQPKSKELKRAARIRKRKALREERSLRRRRKAQLKQFEQQVLNNTRLLAVPKEISQEYGEVKFKIRQDANDLDSEYHLSNDQVKVMWTDINDAYYAESWPERVIHFKLNDSRDRFEVRQRVWPAEVTEQMWRRKKKENWQRSRRIEIRGIERRIMEIGVRTVDIEWMTSRLKGETRKLVETDEGETGKLDRDGSKKN